MSAQEQGRPVEVMRGTHKDLAFGFGPLPGLRIGDVVAYEFELPERYEPWPGRTRLERTFVLLDVGVSFAQPCWVRETRADGSIFDNAPLGRDTWYVDLITVDVQDERYLFRDLYIDIMVPTDGRHARLLDLEEYGDALAAGALSVEQAIDGLRRWQKFLDRYLYGELWPPTTWSDFPPRCIRALQEAPSPFGALVRWDD